MFGSWLSMKVLCYRWPTGARFFCTDPKTWGYTMQFIHSLWTFLSSWKIINYNIWHSLIKNLLAQFGLMQLTFQIWDCRHNCNEVRDCASKEWEVRSALVPCRHFCPFIGFYILLQIFPRGAPAGPTAGVLIHAKNIKKTKRKKPKT